MDTLLNDDANNAAIHQAIQQAVHEVKVNGRLNLQEINKIDKAVQSPKLAAAMQKLVDNDIITQQQVPFFIPSVIQMGLQNNHGKKLTDTQQQDLLDTVKHMQTTAAMEAATPQAAVKIGLKSSLVPYFNSAKVETGATGTHITYTQAKRAINFMEHQHFEKDVKPKLVLAGEIGGGALALAGAAAALAALRRRQKHKAVSAPTSHVRARARGR